MAKPDFEGVARRVAKGPAPEWLVGALEQCSLWTGKDKSDPRLKHTVAEMVKAIDLLVRFLPAFEVGLKGTDPELPKLLAMLSREKKNLQRALRPERGRRPDMQRAICAAVIIEAWKLVHGNAPYRSDAFEQACADYWQACGGKPSGDDVLEGWRRAIERAKLLDNQWISGVFQFYERGQNGR